MKVFGTRKNYTDYINTYILPDVIISGCPKKPKINTNYCFALEEKELIGKVKMIRTSTLHRLLPGHILFGPCVVRYPFKESMILQKEDLTVLLTPNY